MNNVNSWQYEVQDSVAILTFDVPDKPQNTLALARLLEFSEHLKTIENEQPQLKGLIIASGKPNTFIAGADINEFQQIESDDMALQLIAKAHEIFDRLEALSIPTVAQINGHCLGGGMELALACDYRVCQDDSSIRLGLPEVKLGIHPGFGGTVRLIETIGVQDAMNLMLSGRTIIPYVAKKMGVIDLAVPARQLSRSARYLIDHHKSDTQKTKFTDKLLNTKPARLALKKYLTNTVKAKANPKHYPAPFAMIDLWAEHGNDRKAMLKAEQQSVAKLIQTDTAQNLVRVFFVQEAIKKRGKSKDAKPVRHVHVIGAGTMGCDIAAWCALRGLKVTLSDLSLDVLGNATWRAHKLFKRKLKRPRPIALAMDRFQLDPSGVGIQSADLIIEAIVEKVDVKRKVFKQLERDAKPDAILATNTSSIPLEEICTELTQPHRLVGLHFFNPVAKMLLIEIVKGELTDEDVVDSASNFATQISRLPVPVTSSPGFLVNRILMPYLIEAVMLNEEGISAETIDSIATNFGMPMGPIELADVVGLDICLKVADNLSSYFNRGEVPTSLKQKVDAGHLGKKTGQGYYQWSKGKANKQAVTLPDNHQEIEDRLIFRYLNECIACLSEGVVADDELLDGAMIFGTGFAPFKGGPMHYIEANDRSAMHTRLLALQEKFGDRFKPASGW